MRIIIFSFSIYFLSAIHALADQTIYNSSVLVIHSYHKDMLWVEEVHQGLQDTLLGALGDSVDIKVEYMDSKRYVGEDYYGMIASAWRYKYLTSRPDCLIVCDDNALNLALSLRRDLFKDIPIVFCGVNLYDPERFSKIDNITGVVEAYDLTGTLEIIKQLLPDHRRLFIINDDTTTGRANKHRLEEIHYSFADHFNFMYSGNLSIDDLESSVASLSDNTAILLMSFNRDADEKMLRYRDAVHSIRRHSSQPIFGVWSFYLGRGIVGGSLVNGVGQGEKAAELCLQILGGTPASDLPVITVSPNKPMFDHDELQRFAIPKSLLPTGSVIINSPDSLWHRHKTGILLAIGLLIGQFFIITLLVYNVRKRRISEESLQKNQQNLAITLEAIGECVISVDAHYNIMRANPAAADLIGVALEQLPGMSIVELLTERDPAGGKQLADIIRLCCESGESIGLPGKSTLKLPEKPEKRLSGTCSPMRDTFDKIIGAVLICRDITEKETMQAMLAQSRKMEAIGQLAGGVAHDFNNLLTGISGFAELLSLQLRDDKQKSETAKKILSAAGRAKDLTRQLLSFARKGKIISSPVDCHESLLSAIGLLERSINKNITLATDLKATHTTIVGDPVQLENIFLNLGINGADAMPKGGTLHFSTMNEEISSPLTCEFAEILGQGNYLRVSIKDTGCGIDKELRQTIFEPFFTTKASGKGTGLGLSAVFGAMKEHGGRIRLLTEIDKGTEFSLYFPVEKTVEKANGLQHIPLQEGSGTILVIDDESLVLSSAEGLLSELGYVVLLANGGEKGIEMYRKHVEHVDLVLLDMIMPVMDGVTCFRQLKEINENIKVVICSGFSKTSRINEAEKMGVQGFLQKPYTAAEVSRAISQALAT